MVFFRLPYKKSTILVLLSTILCIHNIQAQLVRDLIIILDPWQQEKTASETLTRAFTAAVQEGAAPVMASTSLANNAKFVAPDNSVLLQSPILTIVIPPAYIKKIHQEAESLKMPASIGDAELCGFNFNPVRHMKKKWAADEATVELIKRRVLATVAGHECMWNIFLIGHGYYVSETSNTVSNAPTPTQQASVPEKPKISSKMLTAQTIIRFFSQTTEKEGGSIAGFQLHNFKKFLQFLNGKQSRLLLQQRQDLLKRLELLKTQTAQSTSEESKEAQTLTQGEVQELKTTVAQTWQTVVANKLKRLEKKPEQYAKRKKELLSAPFATQLESALADLRIGIKDLVDQQQEFPTITTGIFCYLSCYVGGFNRRVVEQILKDISFQGYVLSMGIGNLEVNASTMNLRTSFKDFFEQIHALLQQTDTTSDNKESNRLNQKLNAIANAVGGNEWYNNLYAFWYVPGRDTFETYSTAKNVFVLGNVVAKQHEVEKKLIDASSYPMILEQPMRIMPSLKIAWGSAIVPLYPHEATELQTLRYINSLHVSSPTDASLLQHDFFAYLLRFQSPFDAILLIKKLDCPLPILKTFPVAAWPDDSIAALKEAQKNPTLDQCNKRITLENVIIAGRLPGRIHIACSYNNANYHAFIPITNDELELKSPYLLSSDFFLETIAKRIAFTPTTTYGVDKEFKTLYQFIQRRDLARSGKVTDEDIQRDNKKYETTWAEEKAAAS